ncbi:E3 ubiquitin-protein ligase MUL1 [Dendrobium catenatum]|uniref:E3 ubiquitin-protein ligase MUL1 n=1 Tax=Dendrobium catenatum TaxID=906689 RepID=A0A2I0WEF1_9ASPA|nr:E3 ubiquitin-protein ligase MUL1 [Dendrobium catenatum]
MPHSCESARSFPISLVVSDVILRPLAIAVAPVVVADDSAILGVSLAIYATTSWVKYLASSSSLDRIHFAPSPWISDLRAPLASYDGECEGEGEGELVVVRD